MARVKMPANRNMRNNISSSSSSTRSLSPPSATSTPKRSGNNSSQSTSFKSISDHFDETDTQSPLNEINQTPLNSNFEHANQTQNKTSEISQILRGTVLINVETIHASRETIVPQIDPIQCSQPNVKTTTASPKITATPLSTIQPQTKTKTASSSHKTKKSKSFDSSKIRRSNRIALGGGRKPVIDTTIYCIDYSEDTLSKSPKTLSVPEFKIYTRKNSLKKSKPKSSEDVGNPEEENLVNKQLKKIHTFDS
jgi:hypothetical protein